VSFHALTRQHRTLDRLRLRLQVARQQTRLDTELAEGANPADDPALALRAQQLTEDSTRRALGNTLQNLLDAAEEPPQAWGPAGPRPPLQRDAILAARDQLLALADQLRQRDDISPQATALAALLVWDSASPIYTDQQDTTVAQWSNRIFSAL
jgi:ribonuclease D